MSGGSMIGLYWLACRCGAISGTHRNREELLDAARTAPLLDVLRAELVWDLTGLELLDKRRRMPGLAEFLARHERGYDHGRHGLFLRGLNAAGVVESEELPRSHYAKLAAKVRRAQRRPRLEDWPTDRELPRDASGEDLVATFVQRARGAA